MTYSTFKSLWHSALDEAGLLSPYDRPDEVIDIGDMNRRYSIRLGLRSGPQPSEPFTTSCVLSWRWDALQSARTSTTEEDLLTQLHGRDEAADMDTERPWLRVDVELHASLPWGECQKMPGKATWKRFVAAVAKKVAPSFPVHEIDFNDGTAVLGWCGQRRRLSCARTTDW